MISTKEALCGCRMTGLAAVVRGNDFAELGFGHPVFTYLKERPHDGTNHVA